MRHNQPSRDSFASALLDLTPIVAMLLSFHLLPLSLSLSCFTTSPLLRETNCILITLSLCTEPPTLGYCSTRVSTDRKKVYVHTQRSLCFPFPLKYSWSKNLLVHSTLWAISRFRKLFIVSFSPREKESPPLLLIPSCNIFRTLFLFR